MVEINGNGENKNQDDDGSGKTATDGGSEVEKEIGHDEFDPKGTLALILVYLGILSFMWVFMYFIEFLGNGPTVTG